MSEDNNIQNLEEKRRQKAKNFTLNIHDDILDEPAEPATTSRRSLTLTVAKMLRRRWQRILNRL